MGRFGFRNETCLIQTMFHFKQNFDQSDSLLLLFSSSPFLFLAKLAFENLARRADRQRVAKFDEARVFVGGKL